MRTFTDNKVVYTLQPDGKWTNPKGVAAGAVLLAKYHLGIAPASHNPKVVKTGAVVQTDGFGTFYEK